MNQAVLDCLVEDYEELIEGLQLPDPDDRHVLAAAIASASDAIVTFIHGEEAAYEDWVRRHAGYVLIERPDGFMLHEADCTHLGLASGSWSISKPRRCSKLRSELVQWTADHSGSKPLLCQSCM